MTSAERSPEIHRSARPRGHALTRHVFGRTNLPDWNDLPVGRQSGRLAAIPTTMQVPDTEYVSHTPDTEEPDADDDSEHVVRSVN